jgi:type IV secretory pathway TraG/TraD family ATPase VirD4
VIADLGFDVGRLSDRIGDRTITFVTQTQSSGVSERDALDRGGPTYTSGSSLSMQAQARRLMKPEEILNMMDGMELLFVKGHPPMQAGKFVISSGPNSRGFTTPPEQRCHLSCPSLRSRWRNSRSMRSRFSMSI